MGMGGKSLESKSKKHVQEFVRKLVEEEFGGNQTEAGKALGLSQAMISSLIASGRGGGLRSIVAIADYTKKSTDEILGRKRSVQYEGGENRAWPSTAVGNHPGFEKAWLAAATRYGQAFNAGLHDQVASMSGGFGMPEKLTPELIKQLHDAVAMAEAAKAEQESKPKHRHT